MRCCMTQRRKTLTCTRPQIEEISSERYGLRATNLPYIRHAQSPNFSQARITRHACSRGILEDSFYCYLLRCCVHKGQSRHGLGLQYPRVTEVVNTLATDCYSLNSSFPHSFRACGRACSEACISQIRVAATSHSQSYDSPQSLLKTVRERSS